MDNTGRTISTVAIGATMVGMALAMPAGITVVGLFGFLALCVIWHNA